MQNAQGGHVSVSMLALMVKQKTIHPTLYKHLAAACFVFNVNVSFSSMTSVVQTMDYKCDKNPGGWDLSQDYLSFLDIEMAS